MPSMPLSFLTPEQNLEKDALLILGSQKLLQLLNTGTPFMFSHTSHLFGPDNAKLKPSLIPKNYLLFAKVFTVEFFDINAENSIHD
jgi:hypothetical protein